MRELRSNLAELVEAAAAGEEICIVRGGRVVARLSGTSHAQVHTGSRFGRANLRAALERGTGGRSLEMLEEGSARRER
jgi:prevent-host-death family protein